GPRPRAAGRRGAGRPAGFPGAPDRSPCSEHSARPRGPSLRIGGVGAAIDVLPGVASVPRDEWNELVAGASPFLEWEWLASLEEAGCVGARTGWLPRPLVVRVGGRIVVECPL